MVRIDKRYLGDGVYVEADTIERVAVAVRLTTTNGMRDTNTIILEPEVWAALVRWCAEAKVGQ